MIHDTEVMPYSDGEQRRHENYSSLRQIGNRSAVLKASGNHLASVGMGLRELFNHDPGSKWVDGGHSLQAITGTNSWVQWEYESPHQLCLYRITPSAVQVRQAQHARPLRNPQMELVDAGPNGKLMDASIIYRKGDPYVDISLVEIIYDSQMYIYISSCVCCYALRHVD